MSDNFQQTVDLREQMEKRKRPAASKSAIAPLEKIYLEDEKKDLATISRPKAKEAPVGLIKAVVFILAILAVAATAYFLFFRAKNSDSPLSKTADWYAVKLVNGEIFYGQVADIKADPVALANVYYNYDQAKQNNAKDQSKSVEETGNIRLVKRGKETHGPDGSMDIVRAQVLFMEPLKADSKVLQAILQYEK
ncbi:MAG: hypothetical protein Q7R92_00615 [bacterium]|nr:hypothetical protein [bacterium]